jgi:hypothetical protein
MQRSIEWPADQVFRRHCVCRCYSRLITTSWFWWSHCHCSWRSGRLSFAMVGEFWVDGVPANKEVNENNVQIMSNSQSRFLLSTFLQDSGRSSTGLPILPIAKEQTRPKNDVWFYVLMKTTSNNMVFLDHQNKCSPCWSFVSLLYRGFKFHPCAIAVSGHCKTSRDASIKNTIVDTVQNWVFVMPVVFYIYWCIPKIRKFLCLKKLLFWT